MSGLPERLAPATQSRKAEHQPGPGPREAEEGGQAGARGVAGLSAIRGLQRKQPQAQSGPIA